MENCEPTMNTENQTETDLQEKKILEERKKKQETQAENETTDLKENEIEEPLHDDLLECADVEESKRQTGTYKDITQDAREVIPTASEHNEEAGHNEGIEDLLKHASTSTNLMENLTPPTFEGHQQPSQTAITDEEEEKRNAVSVTTQNIKKSNSNFRRLDQKQRKASSQDEPKLQLEDDFLGQVKDSSLDPITIDKEHSSQYRFLVMNHILKHKYFEIPSHGLSSSSQPVSIGLISETRLLAPESFQKESSDSRDLNTIYKMLLQTLKSKNINKFIWNTVVVVGGRIQSSSSMQEAPSEELLTRSRLDGQGAERSQLLAIANMLGGVAESVSGSSDYIHPSFKKKLIEYGCYVLFNYERFFNSAAQQFNANPFQMRIGMNNPPRFDNEHLNIEQPSDYFRKLQKVIDEQKKMIERQDSFRERELLLKEREMTLKEQAMALKQQAMALKQQKSADKQRNQERKLSLKERKMTAREIEIAMMKKGQAARE